MHEPTDQKSLLPNWQQELLDLRLRNIEQHPESIKPITDLSWILEEKENDE
ncbi:hypothetical protein GCM10023149_51050 [Mucilaginibacter gynuensis]|uniref:Addiction module component n=1 Tax=Mucilaginibacter gynuensis TaxID=1302236 RepID=A0ABP8HIV8_9SPHI